MLKVLLTVLFVTMGFQTAYAGANFTTSLHSFEGENNVYPIVGLAVDQHLFGKFYLSSWAGIGTRPVLNDTKHWGSMKLGLDYRMKSFQFGAGVGANVTSEDWEHLFPQITDSSKEMSAYVKASYKLW